MGQVAAATGGIIMKERESNSGDKRNMNGRDCRPDSSLFLAFICIMDYQIIDALFYVISFMQRLRKMIARIDD